MCELSMDEQGYTVLCNCNVYGRTYVSFRCQCNNVGSLCVIASEGGLRPKCRPSDVPRAQFR